MKRVPSKDGYCTISKDYPRRGGEFGQSPYELRNYIGPIQKVKPAASDQKANWCISLKAYTEKYIFFDFECMQETLIDVSNLIVVIDYEGNIKVLNDNNEF
jgi:hypothetical protein